MWSGNVAGSKIELLNASVRAQLIPTHPVPLPHEENCTKASTADDRPSRGGSFSSSFVLSLFACDHRAEGLAMIVGGSFVSGQSSEQNDSAVYDRYYFFY